MEKRCNQPLSFLSSVLTFLFCIVPYQLRASLAQRQLMTFPVIGTFPAELKLSQSLLIRTFRTLDDGKWAHSLIVNTGFPTVSQCSCPHVHCVSELEPHTTPCLHLERTQGGLMVKLALTLRPQVLRDLGWLLPLCKSAESRHHPPLPCNFLPGKREASVN